MDILTIDHLTKVYGSGPTALKALDDVSLSFEHGKIHALLGRNGAGKSTLLKMVCGMLRPTSGSIAFAGRPWTRDSLNSIGALIETPPLYENLTARENLRVRTTLLGLPESRIDEALAIVDLANTGSKRAGQFSLGMKQRLGIALALVGHPRLLILDEPTAGLDPAGAASILANIETYRQANHATVILVSHSVVLSSHILGEVEHVADLVGIIVGGRLAYEAPLGDETDLERLFMDVCLGKAVA